MDQLNYEQWIEKFKPIKNKLVKGAPMDGRMFETYGKELERVQSSDIHFVWTMVEYEGKTFISPGHHRNNRLGYFITKYGWYEPEKDLEILISDDEDADAPVPSAILPDIEAILEYLWRDEQKELAGVGKTEGAHLQTPEKCTQIH